MVESIARTDRLWCSGCKTKIKKGSEVWFNGDACDVGMKKCLCPSCHEDGDYSLDDYYDSLDPGSSEALGQW